MDCSLPFTACNRRIYFSTLESWTLERLHQSMKSRVHNKGVRYVNLLPERPYHYATLIPTCYRRKSLPILCEENSTFNGKAINNSSLVDVSSEERSIQQEQNNRSYKDNGALNLASDTFFGQPSDKEELIALRTNAVRSKLLKKLSEANQFGRHLQRQLYEMEESLLRSKNEFASMELEISALVDLSIEIAKLGVPPKTRKINGKYVHSHLALRLKEMQRRLHSQVKDLDAMSYREVSLRWCGMAEQVEVMGSFDGWTRGQQMSPENSGTITHFNTTLKLVPARYEIKFLVDGEWRVSPELPTVGEGLTENNVIIVQ